MAALRLRIYRTHRKIRAERWEYMQSGRHTIFASWSRGCWLLWAGRSSGTSPGPWWEAAQPERPNWGRQTSWHSRCSRPTAPPTCPPCDKIPPEPLIPIRQKQFQKETARSIYRLLMPPENEHHPSQCFCQLYFSSFDCRGCRKSCWRFNLVSGKLASIQNRETPQIQIWSCESKRVGRASFPQPKTGRLATSRVEEFTLFPTDPYHELVGSDLSCHESVGSDLSCHESVRSDLSCHESVGSDLTNHEMVGSDRS